MVSVGSFCIDSTEVTERDYTLFLDAKKGDTSGQIAACSWNTSYNPDPAFFPRKPQLPIRTIDWCDASAYCAWAGKRLCGAIGAGTVSKFSTDDPSVDQWFHACTKSGAREYPYGATYDATACQTGTSGAVEVKTMAKCEGGYPGIFDMSGNVWEWEDSCEDPTKCPLRGGGWGQKDIESACSYVRIHYAVAQKYQAADIGFRCCAP